MLLAAPGTRIHHPAGGGSTLSAMGLPEMNHSGKRSELVSALNEMSEGWSHLCKPELSEAAKEAAVKIENGESSVRVGHTTYKVSEPTDNTSGS